MGKKQRPEEIAVGSGLVLVDKPAGWTSHDVVGRIRRLAGTRKVGHAGTLDPMATGVLVVGVNRATRLLTHIVGASKTYTATVRLGVSTTTDDADGEEVRTRFANAVDDAALEQAVGRLRGEIMQVPATVSAIRVAGRRAYDRARSGEEVELEARPVTVRRFDVLEVRRIDGGRVLDVDVEVDVSSGTYVRALARDLGEMLEVGGHLTALRRTAVGSYRIENALTLDDLAEDFGYIGLAEAAALLFPCRDLTAEEAADVGHGRRITASESEVLTAAFDPDGELVALLQDVPAKSDASASGEAAQAARRGAVRLQAKPELVFRTSEDGS
ncbi:MAG: tRNA pseudouridine(55) synthase TruB [Nesterenkonia sp.]|nr:tRNA pseudouridine(55) synthase TruB [Nesterenkonia sp.]